MYAVLAFIPIFLVIILMVVFNVQAKKAIPSAWLLCCVLVGLPQVIVLALQNAGGAIGNMICVNNVISACATTGISGKEGRIIRMNFIPCLLFCLLICISAVIIAGTGLAG